MTEHPVASFVAESHAPEMTAVHMWKPIELGQAAVHECVIGAQQVEDAAILAELAFEEELRLARERLLEIVIEVRKHRDVGRVQAYVSDQQPLTGKVADHGRRSRIGEHATYLPGQRLGIVQLAALGDAQQFLVRAAAPQEE